jgi:Fe-S-cluster containining protein
MDSRVIISNENYDELSKEHQVGFPCLGCQKDCCTDYEIFITHLDLKKIHKNVPDLPLDHYVGITDIFAKSYPRIMVENVPKQLVIKKAPFSTKCVFLSSGVTMCSIHDHSPYICQMYPFQVPYDDYKSLELRQNRRCTKAFLPYKHRIEALIKLSQDFWEKELPEFERVVNQWNSESPEKGATEMINYMLQS